MLTLQQRWAIGVDLALMRQVGFQHVRLLTTTKAGDPAYNTWPASLFLTFPQPTAAELSNLAEFLAMVGAAEMTYEIDAVFSVMFTGPLNSRYRQPRRQRPAPL